MRLLFAVFPIMFMMVFALVFGVIGYTIFKSIKQEHKNNQSPRLTFVTFQVKSGDRMELSVTGAEYGLLVEGDLGDLSFQGTRYLGFQRKVSYDL